MFDLSDIDRFWSKVRIKEENECWIWINYIRKDGYGRFTYKDRNYLAHVFAFMLENNIILFGREVIVRHTCNNRACCNPKHLEDGTYLDNSQDAVKAGTLKSPDNKGIKNHFASVNEKDVKRIRKLGKILTPTQILRLPEYENKIGWFGIYAIIKRISWKHIP